MFNKSAVIGKVIGYIQQHIGIIVVGVVLVGAGASFIIQQNKNTSPPNENDSAAEAFVPQFESEQIKEIVEEGITSGIKIPGYSSIIVSANTKDVAVDLLNPEENNVYFKITFLLTDTEEQIYQSKLIKPGQHLYSISLDRELEVGDYDLTIVYDTFSIDESYTPKNGATVNCVLKAM